MPRATAIPARWAASLLCCGAAAGALAATRVTPEAPLNPLTGTEPVHAFMSHPQVTCTGTGYAATWADNRSGNEAVYGALFDLDGGVVLPGRRVLWNIDDSNSGYGAFGCQRGAEMLWTIHRQDSTVRATSFLHTTPALVRTSRTDLPGLQVHTSQVLDCAGPKPLWVSPVLRYGPDDLVLNLGTLAADGGLEPLDGGGPLVARLRLPAINDSRQAAVWDGARHLVVWVDGRGTTTLPDGGSDDPYDVYGAFVDPAAGASAPYLLAGGVGEQRDPQLAFDGTRSLVLWTTASAPGAQRDVWARTVSPAGALGAPFPVAQSSADEFDPALTFDGTSFVAAWQDGTNLLVASISVAPVTVGAPTAVEQTSLSDVRLASAGQGSSLLVYLDWWRDIRVQSIALRGATPATDAGGVDFATTVTSQLSRFSARGGSAGQVVGWLENDSTVAVLVGDAGPVGPVKTLAPVPYVTVTGLAWDGRQFLAAIDDDSVSTRRFTADLDPIEAAPVIHASGPASTLSNPAWDGRAFLVASAEDDGTGGRTLFVHQISTDGGLVSRSAVGALAGAVGWVDDFQLAANDRGTALLTWDRPYQVYASCVADGGLVNAAPVTFAPNAAYNPRTTVASDGQAFLVVYVAQRPSGPFLQAYRVREDCSTDLDAGLDLGPTKGAQEWRFSTTFDGRQYLVGTVTGPDPKGDLTLYRLNLDGGLDAPVVVAADPTADEVDPVVSAVGPGRWLFAYSRFEPSEALSARRAFYRWVSDDGLGSVCGAPAECASGFCVGGRCSATPASDGGAGDGGAGDGGAGDGGAGDGGAGDGGAGDGGAGDGGAGDGGTDDGGAPQRRSARVGCDCSSGPGPMGLALLAAAGWLSRRRRR